MPESYQAPPQSYKALGRFVVVHCDPNGTQVACQHTWLTYTGDGSVEQVALKHGVMLGHDWHDHRWKFRALGFVH